MKTRVLSILILFLLITSVSIPVVTAEEIPKEYYQLHNMCICGAEEDLGHIPYLNWGIGYKAWIDKQKDEQNDKWKVFVRAGSATKELTITPNTDLREIITLIDFIKNVDKCKEETDEIPLNILAGLGSGTIAATAILAGAFYDNAYLAMPAGVTGAITVDEVRQSVNHWNNAIKAQKNAEILFGEL